MIVVDVETTGTDPSRHSIVSIGAVDFGEPSRQFYRECRPWDGAAVDAGALAVNGVTHEQLADPARASLQVAVGEFLAWARGDGTLGGHNTAFDRDFLQAACDKYRMAWPFGYRVVDMMSVGWAHMMRAGQQPPGGGAGLKARLVFAYVGLPEEPKPHNALTGAKMEAEALHRLLWGKHLMDEFSGHPVPNQASLL